MPRRPHRARSAPTRKRFAPATPSTSPDRSRSTRSRCKLVSGTREQIHQVFRNLRAVANAAGGAFGDLVKLNVYLIDLADFALVNEVMAEYFEEPYPARAAIGVASLPLGARVEMEGVLVLSA